jgi:hypothetical protein
VPIKSEERYKRLVGGAGAGGMVMFFLSNEWVVYASRDEKKHKYSIFILFFVNFIPF